MSKVDKDTRAELRRLVAVPGHDRMGLMAKGCISDLLDELEKLEAMEAASRPQSAPKTSGPVVEVKPEKVYADIKKPKSKWNSFKSKDKLEDKEDPE
jgi:hypothetical protein